MAGYNNGTVSVTTTPTLIATPVGGNDGVLIQNNGGVPVFLGGSEVTPDQTSTGGIALAAGVTLMVPTVGNQLAGLYGVVASGTANVAYLYP